MEKFGRKSNFFSEEELIRKGVLTPSAADKITNSAMKVLKFKLYIMIAVVALAAFLLFKGLTAAPVACGACVGGYKGLVPSSAGLLFILFIFGLLGYTMVKDWINDYKNRYVRFGTMYKDHDNLDKIKGDNNQLLISSEEEFKRLRLGNELNNRLKLQQYDYLKLKSK
jgi:hypothetical protein